MRCVGQKVRDSACHGGVGVGYCYLWKRSTIEKVSGGKNVSLYITLLYHIFEALVREQ